MLEENKIHLGDCLNLMPSIPSKSIDMILCDLPYGTTACEWDSIIDMGRLWQEYERVIKDNGAIVLTANSVFTFKLWSSNPSLFRYKWIWIKSIAYGFLNSKKRPLTSHEDVLIFYKKQPNYNPQMRQGDFKPYVIKDDGRQRDHLGSIKAMIRSGTNERLPLDYLCFDNSNFNSLHPTQKPVALFEYLIKTYTNENDLVLDNCSGSGTTAVACMNTNRRFICIERDETYHKKSLERLANHEPLLHMLSAYK
jgi:site-specific DNA-methyltransferase (adenine-specific)